jgi:hypothetical protein
MVSQGLGEHPRAEEIASFDADPHRRLMVLCLSGSQQSSGFWALTSLREARLVETTDTSTNTPATTAEREAMLDWYVRYRTARGGAPAAVRPRTMDETRPSWAGIAHSTGAALAGGVLLVSMIGNGRRVRRGRYGPGFCRACGYPEAGLPEGGRCPECGGAKLARASGARAARPDPP